MMIALREAISSSLELKLVMISISQLLPARVLQSKVRLKMFFECYLDNLFIMPQQSEYVYG